MIALPAHLRAELDRLGVRTPPEARHLPPAPMTDQWYKEGRECPF